MPRFEGWTSREIANGDQVSQYLAGLAGMMLTTLPTILVLPLWVMFTNKYKITNEKGNVDGLFSFLSCLSAGAIVWLLTIAFFYATT